MVWPCLSNRDRDSPPPLCAFLIMSASLWHTVTLAASSPVCPVTRVVLRYLSLLDLLVKSQQHPARVIINELGRCEGMSVGDDS